MQRSQDAKEPVEDSEPTHTGTRSVQSLRAAQGEHALPRENPRGATRPSAFGLPPSGVRNKPPTPAPSSLEPGFTSAVVEKSVVERRVENRVDAAAASAQPPAAPATPTASATSQRSAADRGVKAAARSAPVEPSAMAPRALGAPLPAAPTPSEERHPTPRVKTDIEQLLPISHVAKSLPEPPRLPQIEPARSSPRRFPWISLATFAVMITASALTLTRYSGTEEPGRAAATAPGGSGAAEFERARTHFSRGEVADAERWVVIALRKNSRVREYHAFYAELLEHAGRREQAAHERALAAE